MNVETTAYQFLVDVVAAAEEDTTLFGAEVQTTAWEKLIENKNYFIQIGPCVSTLAPDEGVEEAQEFNARLLVVLLARVPNSQTVEGNFAVARDKVIDMAKAIAVAVFIDSSMGDTVFDAVATTLVRDFDSIHAGDFAVANLTLMINQTSDSVEGV